jgi:hypothetical protein
MLRRLDGKPVLGRLVYRRSERGFDVEPQPERGVTSLLVNDTQIEIDEDGRLIYVWGFCPHESWKSSALNAPGSKPGCLQYIGEAVVPGVSRRLNAGQRWNISYDSSSQWLCIGDESAHDEMVVFAPGAVAALKESELVALWLHPDVQE